MTIGRFREGTGTFAWTYRRHGPIPSCWSLQLARPHSWPAYLTLTRVRCSVCRLPFGVKTGLSVKTRITAILPPKVAATWSLDQGLLCANTLHFPRQVSDVIVTQAVKLKRTQRLLASYFY